MNLRLRRPRADGAQGDEVREVLRADGVEHFAGDGQALGRDVAEEPARDGEAFVDLEGSVQVGVVDQPLPAHRRPRLLEIRSHDDDEVGVEFDGQRLQAVGVLKGRGGIVQAARAADHEEPVGCLADDAGGVTTTFVHGLDYFEGLKLFSTGDLYGTQGGTDGVYVRFQ